MWALFIAYILLISIFHSYRQSVILDNLTYGDWIVDYSQGFVRRGLPGQLILAVGAPSAAPTLIFGIKVVFYSAMLFAVYAVFRPLLKDSLLAICLIMPMSFAFTSIEPSGAGRKEILLLLVLAAQVALLTMQPKKPIGGFAGNGNTSVVLVLAGLTVIVLSHEGLLFFSVFPLLVLYLSLRPHIGTRAALLRAGLIFCWLLALFIILIAVPVTSEQVALMCAELGNYAPSNCLKFSGISWLSFGSRRAVSDVIAFAGWGALHVYLISGLLSALPIYILVRTSRQGSDAGVPRHHLIVGLLLANLATLPPYLVGTDWGRWQYITVCSNLLVLGYCYRASILSSGYILNAASQELARFPTAASIVRPLLGVLLTLFLTIWNAPHFGNEMNRGHVGRLERFAAAIMPPRPPD